ncbi:MAG: hypothetical protein HY321_08585 [Armatimonadetes bacterium]|nr:hypothetical protein [Armatimonadota bacterium]
MCALAAPARVIRCPSNWRFHEAPEAAPSGVAWSIEEGAAGGSISESGLYTAPYVVLPTTFHVVATSAADPTKRGTAAVLVVHPGP